MSAMVTNEQVDDSVVEMIHKIYYYTQACVARNFRHGSMAGGGMELLVLSLYNPFCLHTANFRFQVIHAINSCTYQQRAHCFKKK